MKRSKRFEKLDKKPINQDSFFVEWPEGGLSAIHSPYDPKPSLIIEDGIVVEMDGKKREDFDSLELFISDHSINLSNSEEAMNIPAQKIARMIVDINVSREEIVRLTTAITPAKMLEVLKCMNAVELMMGQMKMRRRKKPANQAHVTNILDSPALLAADAAEAALRGFVELETTCAVSRYAPFNAISILVGGLSARPGVLTQCAMEESLEVKMGMRGLTSYAETVSLYGTEKAMDDGDDTIWSKSFLASVYASRGMKMRCTSGTGAEVLLGHADKKSMLYLEIICVFLAKGAGIQGVQNGSISCIGVATAVPEGFVAIAAENLTVSLLDLEVASGNDQTFSHSDMRRTAKLLMQMLPGTDFITSGYSAMPNFDDVFAGSNTDCDDYDDYYMMQRDFQIDGGIEPIKESEAISARNRAATACQALFKNLEFPLITDDEVEAATYAYSSEEMPRRNMAHDLEAAKKMLDDGITALDIVTALKVEGFHDIAQNILGMLKARVSGDYLQVSAIFDENQDIVGGLNNANDYKGPGSGYRLDGERWKKLRKKSSAIVPDEILEEQNNIAPEGELYKLSIGKANEIGMADVVIGISPAYANYELGKEICEDHFTILNKMIEGAKREKSSVQIIKIYETNDLAEIADISAGLSKKGIGIAIQAKGRVYIKDARNKTTEDLRGFFGVTLANPEDYYEIGVVAGRLARGEEVEFTISNTSGGLSKYQLEMIKLSVDSRRFIKRTKAPDVIKIEKPEKV